MKPLRDTTEEEEQEQEQQEQEDDDWMTERLSYLPTPPLGQDMTQGLFLSGV